MQGHGRAISLSLTFGFLILISYTYFYGDVDLRSHFFPLPQNPSPAPAASCAASPLKVYMYDLPRRFNVGMLNRRSSDDSPVTVQNLPPWSQNFGLGRQHSAEYWLLASLLYEGGGDEMEAIRVSDPESAGVFFVPFFSSLSVNTHGRNMTDPETEVDHQLQVRLMPIASRY